MRQIKLDVRKIFHRERRFEEFECEEVARATGVDRIDAPLRIGAPETGGRLRREYAMTSPLGSDDYGG
jgi:hypothetical protein